MKKFYLAAVLSALFASTAYAQKAPFSYDYVEATYEMGEADLGNGNDLTISSFGVNVSKSLNDTFFVAGSATYNDVDDAGHFENYSLGLGGKISVTNSTDLVGQIAYTYWDMDEGINGVLAAVGIRHKLADAVEVNGGYAHTELEDGSFGAFVVGLRYKFSDSFSAGLNYKHWTGDIDGNQYGVALKLDF